MGNDSYRSSHKRSLVLYGVSSALSLRFLKGHAEALRNAGLEMAVISSPGPEFDEFVLSEAVKGFSLPINREISPLRDIRSLFGLLRIIRTVTPDVTNFGTPKAGLLGSLAAAMAHVPCRLYTMRGLRLESARGWKRIILYATEWVACKCAHVVICVSPSLRNRAIELKLVSRDKALVVGSGTSNGIALQHFCPTLDTPAITQQLRQRLNIPERAPVLGFVGRFTRDKGVPELLQAYAALRELYPELQLLLVGDFEDGDPVPEHTRLAIIQDPGVIRCGFVSDTAPYYHMMDLLAFPTHREGFPNAPLEAQAACKPVVTTDATGAIDSVVNGETGILVSVGSVAALQSAIRILLDHPQRCKTMGEKGLEWVKQFDGESVRSSLVLEYQKLLWRHGVRCHTALPQRRLEKALKRIVDLFLAGFALLLLWPLMLLVGLIVKVTMGSPVIFKQKRPGLRAQPFNLFKFRTMSNKTDAAGCLLPDEQRLGRIGKLIRSLSLDELPQLWNVMRGDLSLVGPRPLLMQYLERYTPEQLRRHDVLPGITGWAQVNGRNDLTWDEKFALDLWYIENWSLRLDLKILCRTVRQLLRRQGISQNGHVTATEFQGKVTQQRPASGI